MLTICFSWRWQFTQPSYAEDVDNLGGIQGLAGTRLVIDASQGRPENIAGASTITLTPQATAYNNMGVPGAKSFHLLAPGYGNVAGVALGQANPYFVRHATSPTATVLGDAMSKNPTFLPTGLEQMMYCHMLRMVVLNLMV